MRKEQANPEGSIRDRGICMRLLHRKECLQEMGETPRS